MEEEQAIRPSGSAVVRIYSNIHEFCERFVQMLLKFASLESLLKFLIANRICNLAGLINNCPKVVADNRNVRNC